MKSLEVKFLLRDQLVNLSFCSSEILSPSFRARWTACLDIPKYRPISAPLNPSSFWPQ